MNDSVKCLIAGAAIAVVCGTVGIMGGVWLMRETGSSQPAVNNTGMMVGRRLSPTIQSPGISGQLVFGGQRTPQNPLMTVPPRPIHGSNVTFRPTLPNGMMPVPTDQSQKLDQSPDVKKARAAFMEAQKKSAAAMRKAQAAQSVQGSVTNMPNSIPLAIQVFPEGPSSNGVVQVKAK